MINWVREVCLPASLSHLHSPRPPPLHWARYGTDMTLALGIAPKEASWESGHRWGKNPPVPPGVPESPRAGAVHRREVAKTHTWLFARQSVITGSSQPAGALQEGSSKEVTSQLKLQVRKTG